MAPELSRPPKAFYLALLKILSIAPASLGPADLSRVEGARLSPASSLQAPQMKPSWMFCAGMQMVGIGI